MTDHNTAAEKWLKVMNDKPSFAGRMINSFKFDINLEDYAKMRKQAEKLAKFKLAHRGVSMQEVYFEDVRCEWICPEGAKEDKAILCLHGGGYVIGNGPYCHLAGIRVAGATGFRTLTVDYRLAPEHPFPAALDDAYTAYRGLLKLGISASNIVFFGDSAGGGLCLSLCLKLKDDKEPLPAAVVVLSPATDLTGSGESHITKAGIDPVFSKGHVRIANYYAHDHDLKDPYISPAFGDYSGFPPLLICVGENEILLSDSLMVGEKAYSQGVDVQVQVWKGMFHTFPIVGRALPESREAWKEIADFINSKL
ncbi:MAG: alpha/beta hydrolase [Bacillota bacterium]|nr:alpha/beta hydrolase [Bacillota bacterium]